ncbi:hypothetical protein NECAME_08982 [Necator americanus]|uniref:Uncharacterized protein n=1 Tax=Necator americanus TaxID=51031 RepID=W2THU3_NECAM|nr:hypothetical protein NECAME_08982 [Necator americanus]ETN80741.1 hypothetical protein NECAME_08982 [Necator americanus]
MDIFDLVELSFCGEKYEEPNVFDQAPPVWVLSGQAKKTTVYFFLEKPIFRCLQSSSEKDIVPEHDVEEGSKNKKRRKFDLHSQRNR